MDTNKEEKPVHRYDPYIDLVKSLVAGVFNKQKKKKEVKLANGIEYLYNEYSFRGEDFSGESELLVAGCSMTFGIGVPEQDTWGARLAKFLNIDDFANIGLAGASTQRICKTIYEYLDKYKKPKTLVVLFPNLERTLVWGDKNIILDNSHLRDLEDTLEHYDVDVMYHVETREHPKYIKKPYMWQDILPVNHSIGSCILAIKQLELYCKTAKINLIWSTWDRGLDYLASSVEFQNFMPIGRVIDTDEDLWNSCHKDYKSEENEFHFELGADEGRHWGSHRHIHFAELMLKGINNDRDI